MIPEKKPVERCVDLFVHAPIGIAMFARDTVPTFFKMFVARGQTELDQQRKQAQQQANRYKSVGQLAVKFAGPVVRQQAEQRVGEVRQMADQKINGLLMPRNGNGSPGGGAPAPRGAPAPEAAVAPPVEVPALAIPDYDQLSASQVVDRLDGLTPDELAAVRAYESAHRGRNTILGKITQLTD
ncbi:MAG: hypothetical protein FJW88_05110 [Actinobacteria bacterium]|nr:hypothetical protein [Actinomycetota bacterium]